MGIYTHAYIYIYITFFCSAIQDMSTWEDSEYNVRIQENGLIGFPLVSIIHRLENNSPIKFQRYILLKRIQQQRRI